MKRNYLLSLFVIAGLFACNKNDNTPVRLTPKTATALKVTPNIAQPLYTVMNLAPRQPGENFDTYFLYWNGCLIKVTGPISYNYDVYPVITDGIPVVSSRLVTYDGTSFVNFVNSGTDGNVFEISQIFLGGVPSAGFTADYDSYVTAWDNWASSGSSGAEPSLSVTMKTTYTAQGGIKTFTGKLIKVTEGSQLAIAPVDYPEPKKVKNTAIPSFSDIGIDDPTNSEHDYIIAGSNGNITSAFYNTQGNAKVQITGSYTHTYGTGIYHCWGTITRLDGTFFTFNVTEDVS